MDCCILNELNSTVCYQWIHLGFVLGIFVIPPASLTSRFENLNGFPVAFRFAYSDVCYYSGIKIIL